MSTSFDDPSPTVAKETPRLSQLQPEMAASSLSRIYTLFLQGFEVIHLYLLPLFEKYAEYFAGEITFEEMA